MGQLGGTAAERPVKIPGGDRIRMKGSVEDDGIRVAFVYRPSWRYYDPHNSISSRYHFFFRALRRSKRLQMGYFPAEQSFDTSKLSGKYDVILCTNSDRSTPQLDNVKRTGIPVIAHTHDPHWAKEWDLIRFHEEWGIDAYFDATPASYFYRHFPRSFKYRTVTFGVEPGLPEEPAFKDRIADRILLTGALGESNVLQRLYFRVFRPVNNFGHSNYRLRRACKGLPYVDYSGTVPGTRTYMNGGCQSFAAYLSRYRATIAATRFYPTIKYYESTAAGCLTFMEVGGENDCAYLGFRDGETAIFIDSGNYGKRFEEYLADPDDPRWEQIAARGRRHTMENLTNDRAAEALADMMQEMV